MLKRIASRSLLGFISSAAALMACTGGVSLGKSPAANTAGDGGGADGSTATGPYGITCTTDWSPSAAAPYGEQKTFTVRSDASGSQTLRFPSDPMFKSQTSLSFAYAPANDGSDDALLTVTAPNTPSTQVYRLNRSQRPVAQFLVDQGFTGVVSPSADLGYICSADGAARPEQQPNVVPMDAFCEIQLRSLPSGAIERRETFDLKTTSSVTWPSARTTLTLDGFSVEIVQYDGEFGGQNAYGRRDVFITVRRGDGAAPFGATVGQSIQLNRNTTLYNHGDLVLGTDLCQDVCRRPDCHLVRDSKDAPFVYCGPLGCN